ncbi:ferritin family protein [Bacillus paramycoides]|uniref:ferritin family protein n=1 Tax=Bacillus paramycoides TaxID=2026194 RepID=UPI003CFFB461
MYFQTDNYDALYRQNDKPIRSIEKAMNGEYSTIHCYAKLANLATDINERNQILEIRQDEIKHFHQFVQIHTLLTGKNPQPQITEECPTLYLNGLEFAIQDAQRSVDFYLEIADEETNQQIKEAFRRAAADEQNHAV